MVAGVRIRDLFFDLDSITDPAEKARQKVLSRFGYFTMRDARQSIRKRKSPSQPGRPPRNISGWLKKLIYFGYDPVKMSVVTGPERAKSGSAGDLEHGSDKIQARPYMAPAQERQLQKHMPALWQNSIKP